MTYDGCTFTLLHFYTYDDAVKSPKMKDINMIQCNDSPIQLDLRTPEPPTWMPATLGLLLWMKPENISWSGARRTVGSDTRSKSAPWSSSSSSSSSYDFFLFPLIRHHHYYYSYFFYYYYYDYYLYYLFFISMMLYYMYFAGISIGYYSIVLIIVHSLCLV